MDVITTDSGKFFGAFRASSGITDAVVLNHVPVGCNWGVTVFKIISDQFDIRHACTAMHEREIVFGGEDALREALIRADDLYESPLIIVIAGDVPSIINDDVEAVLNSVTLDSEVIWMEAAGFKGSMRDGYEKALLCLAGLMEGSDMIKNSVNLIGFSPDDFKVDADVKEIKRLLSDRGIKVNSVISKCSLKEFKEAPAAELNVVFGQGSKLAEHMKKEFGIPYLKMDYPYGLEGTMQFISEISSVLDIRYKHEFDIEPFKKIFLYLHELYGTPVSIIGDFHAQAMADFLHGELGFNVEVLSVNEDDHFSFEEEVTNSNTSILFGSSFEQDIAKTLNIPLIRFCYPVFDNVCVYDDAPYAGLRGAVCLTETIINTVMSYGAMK